MFSMCFESFGLGGELYTIFTYFYSGSSKRNFLVLPLEIGSIAFISLCVFVNKLETVDTWYLVLDVSIGLSSLPFFFDRR